MFDWLFAPGLKLVGQLMVGGGLTIAAVGAGLWYLCRNVGGV